MWPGQAALSVKAEEEEETEKVQHFCRLSVYYNSHNMFRLSAQISSAFFLLVFRKMKFVLTVAGRVLFIHLWLYSHFWALDGGSAHRKAAPQTQDNINTE
jgi:hypothetical protein